MENLFHEHLFRVETKVNVVDLDQIQRINNEYIDDYNRIFWRMWLGV